MVHKSTEWMHAGVEWSDTISRAIQQEAAEGFVSLLDTVKSQCELVPDIQVWRWKKTIWVSNLQLKLVTIGDSPRCRIAAGTR